ncbi:hypothetical protein EDD85DRAFT_827019 [Armillaria nabsnona]|nr:hypothetical protein EDD85DRAFT_827019 [Armillaria nabsnona]
MTSFDILVVSCVSLVFGLIVVIGYSIRTTAPVFIFIMTCIFSIDILSFLSLSFYPSPAYSIFPIYHFSTP